MAKRGRPQFRPTATQRREVEEMIACGMSEDDVARAVGIATETLRKHFVEELATAKAKRRGEVIKLLFRNARKGNVSAQKHLEAMTSLAGTARPAERIAPTDKPAARVGKKAQEQADAQNPDVSTPIGELMARRAAAAKLH